MHIAYTAHLFCNHNGHHPPHLSPLKNDCSKTTSSFQQGCVIDSASSLSTRLSAISAGEDSLNYHTVHSPMFVLEAHSGRCSWLRTSTQEEQERPDRSVIP